MKNKGTNKGITLIALVITIIVMLMLVAVTITMAINGGLFGNAGNAVGETQNSINAEQGLASGAITIGGTTYSSIDDYVKGGKAWKTVYEGTATTVDGMELLSENRLFKNGYNYRITGEANGQKETVETVAVFAGIEDGIELYGLFAIHEGEIITWTSYNDAMEKMNNLSENAIVICGCNITNTGSCIMVMNYNIDFTVTKIEECAPAIEGNKVFEGEVILLEGLTTEISGFVADLTKEYMVVFTIDGIESIQTCTTSAWCSLVASFAYEPMIDGYIAFFGNQIWYIPGANEVEIAIQKIYEIGTCPNYVEENGFGLLKTNSEKWDLVTAPRSNDSYIVPSAVGGYAVDRVVTDCISGDIILNNPIEFTNYGDPSSINSVKVIGENYDFIFHYALLSYFQSIDLSECGDNVQIPSEYLGGSITIYVNSTVKARYVDYDNVIAK